MLDDIVVPKYLLLRRALRTVEDKCGKLFLEHFVEVSKDGALLFALCVWTFIQRTFGPRIIDALQTCRAVAALAFLCLL